MEDEWRKAKLGNLIDIEHGLFWWMGALVLLCIATGLVLYLRRRYRVGRRRMADRWFAELGTVVCSIS
jgi:hypothetical protein